MDKRKHKKDKKWDRKHKKWIEKWDAHLKLAKENGLHLIDHPPYHQGAFDNYVAWFVANSRVELCPPAFDSEILENPNADYDFYHERYNRLVREGNQTRFAPLINFVVIL